MSIIILTAVQRTSSINVVKEIAKQQTWKTMQQPRQTSSFSFSSSSSPSLVFVTNNGSKTYGNPFLPLSLFYFFSSSLLLFSLPRYSFETQPVRVSRGNEVNLVLRGERGNEDEERPPRRTKRFQQLSRRIVLIIVTSCLGAAVLESLTQIPVNVGVTSRRKSFFRPTSSHADPSCFLPVRRIPPPRCSSHFDALFVSPLDDIIRFSSSSSFVSSHGTEKASVGEYRVYRNF